MNNLRIMNQTENLMSAALAPEGNSLILTTTEAISTVFEDTARTAARAPEGDYRYAPLSAGLQRRIRSRPTIASPLND